MRTYSTKFTDTKSHRNFQAGDLARPDLDGLGGRGWLQLWNSDYAYNQNSSDKLYFGEIVIVLNASRGDDRLSFVRVLSSQSIIGWIMQVNLLLVMAREDV